MSADRRFFVDTNLLLCAVDEGEPEKAAAARQWVNLLWASGSGRISWQVLHEFYVNATRKMGVSNSLARERVELLTVWRPIDTGLGLFQRAWGWSDHAGLSYWDALIVAAAEQAGCSYLLSEDLQDGRDLGGVLIVNPFRTAPGNFGLVD